MGLDADLGKMSPPELIAEVKRLRAGIRRHRDAQGHDLCWYHPELWLLLPEQKLPTPCPPPTEEFLAQCVAYRRSLSDKG